MEGLVQLQNRRILKWTPTARDGTNTGGRQERPTRLPLLNTKEQIDCFVHEVISTPYEAIHDYTVFTQGVWKLAKYGRQQCGKPILEKPSKPEYSEVKAYRPIALLCTLSKALETVIAKVLSDCAEEHGLLPDQQMRARRGQSTETALEGLVDEVHTV